MHFTISYAKKQTGKMYRQSKFIWLKNAFPRYMEEVFIDALYKCDLSKLFILWFLEWISKINTKKKNKRSFLINIENIFFLQIFYWNPDQQQLFSLFSMHKNILVLSSNRAHFTFFWFSTCKLLNSPYWWKINLARSDLHESFAVG